MMDCQLFCFCFYLSALHNVCKGNERGGNIRSRMECARLIGVIVYIGTQYLRRKPPVTLPTHWEYYTHTDTSTPIQINIICPQNIIECMCVCMFECVCICITEYSCVQAE